MIADLINAIEDELNYQRMIYKKVNRRLKALDGVEERSLIANRNGRGAIQYYFLTHSDNKEKRIYITKSETEKRKELQEKYYLKLATQNIRKNIEMLEYIKDSFFPVNPEEVVNESPLAYREQENANALLYGDGSINRWKERKLALKSKYPIYKPEELQHVADDGTKTRSKSEMLIINTINAKGITYVYECPLILGSKIIFPDFILMDRKTNREIIIEHMGLMADYEYRKKQIDKIGLYIKEGYIPNVNMLMTFDDWNGKINIPAISKMIDTILCR